MEMSASLLKLNSGPIITTQLSLQWSIVSCRRILASCARSAATKNGHRTITGEFTKTALGLEHAGCPHSAAPWFRSASALPGVRSRVRGGQVFNQVGRGQHPFEVVRQPQAHHGQSFLQPHA